jgi:hypothetical protein
MIGVKVKDGLYLVTLPQATLVLTRAAFIQALRRGTWWGRRQALRARQGARSHALEWRCLSREGGEWH